MILNTILCIKMKFQVLPKTQSNLYCFCLIYVFIAAYIGQKKKYCCRNKKFLVPQYHFTLYKVLSMIRFSTYKLQICKRLEGCITFLVSTILQYFNIESRQIESFYCNNTLTGCVIYRKIRHHTFKQEVLQIHEANACIRHVSFVGNKLPFLSIWKTGSQLKTKCF